MNCVRFLLNSADLWKFNYAQGSKQSNSILNVDDPANANPALQNNNQRVNNNIAGASDFVNPY